MKRWILLILVGLAIAPYAIANIALVDDTNFAYNILTDVSISSSVLASGAARDGSYTTSVTGVTTSLGGTTTSTLSDAFVGYNGMLVNGISYNLNGAATTEFEGTVSAVDRQIVFAPQTIGSLTVTRKVFVPDDDSYCRWLDYITNSSASQQAATVTIVSSLGSGTDTKIATTSAAPFDTATTADRYVVSFKDYNGGGHSSAPRLGHILQGNNRRTGLAQINFTDGDGTPNWEYSLSVPAGQTQIIMNVVTGQTSILAASTQVNHLLSQPALMTTFMTDTEKANVVNFDVVPPTVAMSSTIAAISGVATIPVTVTFSETVTGFVIGDLVVGNGTAQNFLGSGAVYTFDLIPAGSGDVTVDIPQGAAVDGGSNGNKAATQFKRTVDHQPPTVIMSSTTPDPSNISTVIRVYVNFSEPVTGFTQADIIPINAKFHKSVPFNGSGSVYSFAILPLKVSGQVGASIGANVATDAAGNGNLAAPDFLHTVGPGVSCFAPAKSNAVPMQAGLIGLAPIGLATLALAALDLRKRKR